MLYSNVLLPAVRFHYETVESLISALTDGIDSFNQRWLCSVITFSGVFCLTAFVTNSLMNPIWMVKTRMQLERK